VYTYDVFWIQNEIKSVASLHYTRPAPTVAGSLISEAGHRELVEANVLDLGSSTTPVVPEPRGVRHVKNPPRSGRRRSRLNPCSTPPEVLAAPPDAARYLAESSLLLRGLRRDKTRLQTLSGWLSCPRARFFPVPCPCSVCFHHLSDRDVAFLTPPGCLRC
jgi:hypothetical protein